MPTILAGQEMEQEEERILEPVPHDQVISLNPVGLFFSNDWFNAEYERKMTEAITGGLGLGWSALDGGKDDYTYFTGFFRYYTTGYAFSGLFVGARGGLVKVDVVDDEGDDTGSTKLGIGGDVGYSWALGPGQAFYVAPSLGFMTLLGDVNDAKSWFPILGAVNIGVAF
jgi:hypothetical protein